MPVIAPQPAANYDTVRTVMNMAEARLNGRILTIAPTSGKLLDNGQPFSQVVANNAWRRCQDHLAEKGYARVVDECIIRQFPIVQSVDPAQQCWLNWSGCFDGNNFFPQPALPQYFNHPIKMWERWSGQNATFGDPMEKMLNGMPMEAKTTRIRFWEWRVDTIYMPGSQMLEDLRIRHVNYLADFVDVGNAPWFAQPVPIMRCGDGLSWLMCAEIATARGDASLTELYSQNGLGALDRIFNLDVQADQCVNIRRRPRTGNGYGSSRRNWY